MKNLYARVLLWIIAPAVRLALMRESRQGGAILRIENGDTRGIEQRITLAVRASIQAARSSSPKF